MDLIVRLADYDGRSVDVLERIRDTGRPSTSDIDDAIALGCGPDRTVAAGATWLLRAWTESGHVPWSPRQWRALIGGLEHVTDPWASLHLAQTVGSMEVPARHAEALADFFERRLDSERPFLRAWAMDALVRIARKDPSVREAAGRAFRAGFEDPAASVRARARRLDAEGGLGG